MNNKDFKKYRANLRFWFEQATPYEVRDGLNWYKDANSFVTEQSLKLNVDRLILSAALADLSPRNEWERNKFDLLTVVDAVKNGICQTKVKVCTFNKNKAKAFDRIKGILPLKETGMKTYSFSKNVGELDSNFVTIDSWHLRACQTRSMTRKNVKETVTAKQYKEVAELTLKVAHEYGLKGYEFQAIVWVVIRNRWMN
jgi:thermostable 8-oxoguanine DNA glycosylase